MESMDIDVVVIAGISGSGKSTLAKMLAAAQSWDFIEADDYHDETAVKKMASGFPLDDKDRFPWLLRLNRRLQQSPPRAGDNRQPYVLSCSALKEEYRNLLVGTLNARFVWLNISHDLASERNQCTELNEGIVTCGDPALDLMLSGKKLPDNNQVCISVSNPNDAKNIADIGNSMLIKVSCLPRVVSSKDGDETKNIDYLKASVVPYSVFTRKVARYSFNDKAPIMSDKICDSE